MLDCRYVHSELEVFFFVGVGLGYVGLWLGLLEGLWDGGGCLILTLITLAPFAYHPAECNKIQLLSKFEPC